MFSCREKKRRINKRKILLYAPRIISLNFLRTQNWITASVGLKSNEGARAKMCKLIAQAGASDDDEHLALEEEESACSAALQGGGRH